MSPLDDSKNGPSAGHTEPMEVLQNGKAIEAGDSIGEGKSLHVPARLAPSASHPSRLYLPGLPGLHFDGLKRIDEDYFDLLVNRRPIRVTAKQLHHGPHCHDFREKLALQHGYIVGELPPKEAWRVLVNILRHQPIVVEGNPSVSYMAIAVVTGTNDRIVEVNGHRLIIPAHVLYAGPAAVEFRKLLAEQLGLYVETLPHEWWRYMVYGSLIDRWEGLPSSVANAFYPELNAEQTRWLDEVERHSDLLDRRFHEGDREPCCCGCGGQRGH